MTPTEMNQIKRFIAQQVAIGMRNPEKTDKIKRDFFVYEARTTLGTPIPAAGSQNDVINIESDAEFILQKLTYHADIASAAFTDSARPIPNVTVLLTDTGSGRQLMQDPIPIPSMFGTGELPFILPNARKFERNTTIQVTFTNFDAATAYNIQLAFIGYKIYARQ